MTETCIDRMNEITFGDVLSEDVPVQWSKKCLFLKIVHEFCDILVGADGINSPEQGQNYKPHYRTSISISYSTKFDNVEKVKVDDNDPVSVVEHVKRRMKNALQALINYSSENYISCIKEYENEMLKRTSAEVLKGRYAALKQASPVGYFRLIFRNNMVVVTYKPH
ncbi:hypothetical protein RhiirA4_420207 [Rhizophagus irregularis]|uniref:Uncharacterized protein n=1 Tax=Rhizophagus irregularis TaxID=588596 RepID=A0A2I1GGX4_9GLOM|nr:hypothetical protein RhiirA4_420207 [Rhizophagus irregularis]